MVTLIAAVGLSIGISALCSLLESVLYSTRAITLESVPEEDQPVARQMQLLKREVETPLSAILILNTVANTAGAALAGWAAGEVWGSGSLWVFSLGFTLAILFFSEIVPKTVGAVYWRHLWRFSIKPLKTMIVFSLPLIFAMKGVTHAITRHRDGAPQISEDEILAAARIGAKEGEITELEHSLIHNIIMLEEVRASDIMTPRTVMFTEKGRRTLDEVVEDARVWPHTRVPVYGEDQEDILGYVLKYQVLAKGQTDPKMHLSELAKKVSYVPASANALTLLTKFLRRREQMCLVVDEWGGISGLITLEDVLETMVGAEIVDESDLVADMQELARLRAKNKLQPEEE